MSFKLQTTDMDLGDTPIENIFINDYMPMANGTYVKVYLLGYKYANDKDVNVELNNTTISKHLDIPLDDVLRAWDFWEKKGIIEKNRDGENSQVNYEVKFLSLKQLYIKNNINIWAEKEDKPKAHVFSTRDLVDANKVPEINKMFNSIDNTMRRQTTPSEKQKILKWIHDYNMNPDVIEKAFDYAVEERGVKGFPYIEKIIASWYDGGYTSMDLLLEHLKENDQKFYRYQNIMKSLGLHKRPIKASEKKMIDTWFDGLEFTLELALAASERVKIADPSVEYLNSIVRDWHKKGIKSVEDIEILDVKEEKSKNSGPKKAPKKGQASVTRFHNFEQRTDKYSSDELEAIARRKRDAYSQRAKGDA